MNCLAVYDSGNFAYRMCTLFERQGYIFEVISLPCKIANQGCGYCLQFPDKYLDMVLKQSKEKKLPVKIVYKRITGLTSNKYERIYPKKNNSL